ncbi:MAG: imidazolonepropionase [Deltaproteobacteria bacterium]|nr:imidazolonepropionase [Deltaproteobacteria bacterium]
MLTIHNIGRLVTMEPAVGREGSLGVIPKAAICCDGEQIAWVGPESDLPAEARTVTSIDAGGGVVLPGLVDSHTHLVHGGWRVGDFCLRARGRTYQEIAASGGGILSTVRATREASPEILLSEAAGRAVEALSLGTTTMEVKSGYGLDWPTERKILQVMQKLKTSQPVRIEPTFLGAHLVPEEYRADRSGYVRALCDEMIPAVAAEGLATCCDCFVEEGAFTPAEARTIAAAASRAGLVVRLHVDQFSDQGGGGLAAEVGAVSADHLDMISDAGIKAMARAGVIAGILPGAGFFVGHRQGPPVGKLVAAGVPIAIATDYNPGTSPTLDLFLCGTIAVTQMGLDPDMALLGITSIAARALGRGEAVGSLAVGKAADLIVLECDSEYFPLYRFGSTVMKMAVIHGEIAWERSS